MAHFETLLGPSLKTVARISSMRLCLDVKAIRQSCLSNEQNIDLQTVDGEKVRNMSHRLRRTRAGMPQQAGMARNDPPLDGREAKAA